MVQRISCCLSRLFPENRETAYTLIHFRAPDVDIGILQNIRDEITAYHPTEEIWKKDCFVHSIRTRITAMTVCVILTAMAIATFFGVTAIRDIGNHDAEQTLLLLWETGQKDLDSYFQNVEMSVKTVAAYVESDLDGVDDEKLQAHINRVSDVFQKLAYNTNGVLTYYYRIDPEVSRRIKGFWYVNAGDGGFREHAVTEITDYDTKDTSSLVWFTVPKATGKGAWLPPYITENLDARVISYSVPVYHAGQFIGVIGIEIEYSTMAEVVNHITLYDHGYAFLNDAEGRIVYYSGH